ncbi:hypothetical protein ACQUEQ_08540 [Enterococcus casseliflavus]|uniref:hypothetical protein n=1 Tax=Enterococcus casseliflavus TaxID=37734 RepID=UPI003D135E98
MADELLTFDEIVDMLNNEPIIFGIEAGFTDLTDIHNDWLKSFLFAEDDQTLLAHRGSYKTTTLAVAIALLIVIEPNDNITFFRKTDTDVIEIIKQVSKILQTPMMQLLAKSIYGIHLILTKDTGSEIDTNLHTDAKGVSQLVGLGIKTSITGKHSGKVITDDIVNITDRISKAEREKTKLQYQELQNVKNRGGRFINTGTPWHKEDAIGLMPNVKRFNCHETGLITKDQLQHLRDSMTSSLFAANYELKHIADEDAMFRSPKFTTDIESIFNGVAQVDPAYGGADGTAFTIFKFYDNKIVGYGRRWDKHVDDCMAEIVADHKKYRTGTLYVENNADKGYSAKNFKSYGLIVSDYHESMNKFMKIVSYLRQYWGQIEWLEGTDPDYINEILDYTENAEHDDSPDSAASLIMRIKGNSGWLF